MIFDVRTDDMQYNTRPISMNGRSNNNSNDSRNTTTVVSDGDMKASTSTGP